MLMVIYDIASWRGYYGWMIGVKWIGTEGLDGFFCGFFADFVGDFFAEGVVFGEDDGFGNPLHPFSWKGFLPFAFGEAVFEAAGFYRPG